MAESCPNCTWPLTYLDTLRKFYCYNCETYVDESGRVEAGPERALPTPAPAPAAVASELVPSEAPAAPEAPKLPAGPPAEAELEAAFAAAKPAPKPCAVCGGPLTYVAKYERYYCYACGTYSEPAGTVLKPVPAAEPLPRRFCPTCGGSLEYIEKYDRWWCHTCRAYAPREPGEKRHVPGAPAVPATGEPAAEVGAAAAAVRTRDLAHTHVHMHGRVSGPVGLMIFGALVFIGGVATRLAVESGSIAPAPTVGGLPLASLLEGLGGVLFMIGGIVAIWISAWRRPARHS